jgi:Mg2+-importing ATPase
VHHSSGGAGFLLEAPHAFRIAGLLERDDLDRHVAAEPAIAAAVHLAHAAGPMGIRPENCGPAAARTRLTHMNHLRRDAGSAPAVPDADHAPRAEPSPSGTAERPPLRWMGWLLGLALLSAVIVFGLHFSEGRELARLTREAQPWWMLVAVALQAATYLAQGEIWRIVIGTSGSSLPRWYAIRLAIAKLFVDQAVPSAGVSGSLLMVRQLMHRAIPHRVIMSVLSVQTASFYIAYLLAALMGVAAAAMRRALSPLALGVFLAFGLMVSAFAVFALWVPGRKPHHRLRRIVPFAPVRRALHALASADPRISRRSRTLVETGALQFAIIVLDAATLWALLRALGTHALPEGVFVSFVLSSVFRTMGIVPGGLGTFEAASVITLRASGVSIPAALGATLLFRALSFWIPMLPGMWLSRRA